MSKHQYHKHNDLLSDTKNGMPMSMNARTPIVEKKTYKLSAYSEYECKDSSIGYSNILAVSTPGM